MNFARAILSFAILTFFTLYVFVNTRTLGGSYGFEFLILFVGTFGVLLVLSGNLTNFVLWRITSIILATFFIYFSAKLYAETGSSYQVHRLTWGTNSGVLFSFFLGLILSQALAAIYDLRQDTKSDGVLYLLTVMYALLVLGLAIIVFMTHRGSVSGDVFLVDETDSYQRVGDLFSIQFLAITSLVCVLASTSKRKRFSFGVIPTLLLMGICGVYAVTSQLLGSNKGLVVPVGILFVYLALILTGSTSNQKARRTSILNILFSGLVFKLLFASLIGLGVMTIFGQTLLQLLGIETDALRITGFGSGEVSSVDSREQIFSENFYLHFMQNPIFGHTQIELLTTGPGTYVHSTLSILTHLGLFGFVIFLCLLLSIYLEISHSFRSKHSSIFSNQTYSLFRLLCLFAVLVMGMFSAFFVWMPLWFAFGLFGNWYQQSRDKTQLFSNKGKSKKRRRSRHSRIIPGNA